MRRQEAATGLLSPTVSVASPPWYVTSGVSQDAFVDYSRKLTPEGGILITFKDIDARWRHTIWRLIGWTTATGFEAWLIHNYSPVLTGWVNGLSLLLVAAVNVLIVIKRVEVYRSIEIRADCMIVERTDVFWLRLIETNWPTLQVDKKDKDKYVLCGIYGNRFMEYVTIHRIDELDRAAEVLATHLHDAMTKLWGDITPGPGVGPSTALGRKGFKRVY